MSDNPFPASPTPEMQRQESDPSKAAMPAAPVQNAGVSPQPAQNPQVREEQSRPSGFLRQTEEVEEELDVPRVPSHHQPPGSGNSQQDNSNGAPPPLQMDERSCRTCEYFDYAGNEREKVAGGECRRSAPSIAGGKKACWPEVKWNAWCGEWELGVSDDDMVRMARDVADRTRASNV